MRKRFTRFKGEIVFINRRKRMLLRQRIQKSVEVWEEEWKEEVNEIMTQGRRC